MSSAEIAVQVYLQLESEDLRLLQSIEIEMSKHRYVPESELSRMTGFSAKQLRYRLRRAKRFGVTNRWTGSYTGYSLKTVGYDCLAMNALVKSEILKAFGKPIGVGKESDVYDAITPDNEIVAVKFHRLGKTSFHQTRRYRGYIADRKHISWIYQSRAAAEKEYEALELAYLNEISAPKPVYQNRHVIVMELIAGTEMSYITEISSPEKVLDEILHNVAKLYQKAEIIHSDLSQFNVLLKPDLHIVIIDWPQYVRTNHPNAELLLKRDLGNILRFFRRKSKVKKKINDALDYVKFTLLS